MRPPLASSLFRFVWLVAVAVSLLAGCPSGERPTLLAIDRTTGRVNETLRIAIPVSNPSGTAVRYRFEPVRELPALDSVATITGSPSGGELRWTPLASHVGMQELTIFLESTSGEEFDRATAIVDIEPSTDAAPVFLEPGAGGTYDLTRDPCVRFGIEVRDDDTTGVTIAARTALPTGATLTQEGDKSASFAWCPAADQIAASERWTIALSADDGDHEPVPHDYIVVLRSGGGTGCEGAPPTVELVAPTGGSRVTSGAGYEVTASVSDDVGLRDAPILYWTTEAPTDPSRPDVTEFQQALFAADGSGTYTARIPSLGLAVGEEREVFVIVSATDNDDASGTACDHRTETLLDSFYAVGGEGGALATCATCSASVECTSGICAPSPGGARCLDACTGSCGGGLTCMSVTTTEGSRADACTGTAGSVELACATSCTDDAYEPNDSVDDAVELGTSLSAQVCGGDHDVFFIDGAFRGDEVEVTLDGFRTAAGDLDLRLLDPSGRILGSSAGVSDTERVTYCASSSSPLYADVFGYDGASNAYDLGVVVRPGACCVDDALEPDDSVGTASLVVGVDFEGTLCYEDDDFRAFDVTTTSDVDITLVPDTGVTADIELYDTSAALLASSVANDDGSSTIRRTLSPGRYVVRVYGYFNEGDAYLGQIVQTAVASTCATTHDCAAGEVCDRGACRADDCTSVALCPADHLCPDPGPASGASDCTFACTANADCRSSEACKWFVEGRGCGTRGTGALGAACSSFRDCGVQRTCVEWPGGYCTRAGCSRNADCESGSYCVEVSGLDVCGVDCSTDASRCRAGYTCRSLRDAGGSTRYVCAP